MSQHTEAVKVPGGLGQSGRFPSRIGDKMTVEEAIWITAGSFALAIGLAYVVMRLINQHMEMR